MPLHHSPQPSHNNRDMDGYICMFLFVCACVCVWDKKRDAFSVSLVTLLQHVIHVDECIKQSVWNSELRLHSGDWTMVKMDSGGVFKMWLRVSALGSLEA